MSEVRGDGRKELPHIRGQWRPGGETPHPRSGWPGGNTLHPRSGAWLRGDTLRLRPMAAGRRNPASKVGAARRSHLAPEARGGDPEEPPLARG